MKHEPAKVKKHLSNDQYKVYKLIWDRFIASQMQDAELATVSAELVCENNLFKASGYTVKFNGFMAVYEESTDEVDEEKNKKLPDIEAGEILKNREVICNQHFTEPPARYTEASLIKFLEEKGIGRPSTYTPIITIIISRGYVSRDGKSLVPTALGEVITELMIKSFPDIVDYQFTASMEDRLDSIEHGQYKMEEILAEFYEGFKRELDAAEATVSKESVNVPVEETDIVCDKCGRTMILKNGRFGKFAACPGYPECKNTKPLVKTELKTEAAEPEIAPFKCEVCGSDMILRSGRYGAFYACVKYPECKFTKQKGKDLGVPCPKCGGELVTKYAKNRSVFYSCSKFPTCDFSSWDMPTTEKCPQCGGMLYNKKGKNLLICKTEGCEFKKESTIKAESDE
jgi:DNA topoisomerase-1